MPSKSLCSLNHLQTSGGSADPTWWTGTQSESSPSNKWGSMMVTNFRCVPREEITSDISDIPGLCTSDSWLSPFCSLSRLVDTSRHPSIKCSNKRPRKWTDPMLNKGFTWYHHYWRCINWYHHYSTGFTPSFDSSCPASSPLQAVGSAWDPRWSNACHAYVPRDKLGLSFLGEFPWQSPDFWGLFRIFLWNIWGPDILDGRPSLLWISLHPTGAMNPSPARGSPMGCRADQSFGSPAMGEIERSLEAMERNGLSNQKNIEHQC